MRKFLSLFSCWLLLSGSISQVPPAAFPDVPVITETSVGKAKIGMPVTQLKQAYKGCVFSPKHLAWYGFDDTNTKPGGVLVASGKQKLFVYFLDWQTNKKVAGILALHPAYKTSTGIHVGSTSGELKAALPAIRTVPNVMYAASNQVFPFQAAFLKKSVIEYDFSGQKDIGPQDPDNYDSPVPITVNTGRISWIQVYPH